jgi:hypothetical protein
MSNPRILVAALFTALVATGCVSAAPHQASDALVGGTAEVHVSNQNWNDMRIYVEQSGSRVRLGTVTSMTRATFRIPRTAVGADGRIQLVADALASRDNFVSRPILVEPGQVVDFTIHNHLGVSNILVSDRQR